MSQDLWDQYLHALRTSQSAAPGGPHYFHDRGEVKTFVDRLPQDERIPLLLTAFERYREKADPCLRNDYGRLVDLLLFARLKPSDAEACVMIGAACAGEEWDPAKPLEIAERAFRNRAYPNDLFDCARAYRDELEPRRTPRTKRARDTVALLLWHDVRHPARGCWMAGVQRAIAAMDKDEAFAWQWLLRNARRGKTWSEEARSRLEILGAGRFLDRLDTWFRFPPGARIRLSFAGTHYLQLLALYCGLTDRARASPILGRLASANLSLRVIRKLGLLA
jgi:hypothetical protein